MNIQISNRLKNLPAYAFKEINDKVDALRAAGIKAIDFGVGDPSEPTPDFVIKGLEAAGYKHAKTGYPSYIGSKEFRCAAAGYMKRRFGVSLDIETEISSNIGSKEAIFNFPEGFINPGDVVIIPSPGYPPMKTGTIFAEGIPYFVPLLEKNNFLVDYEAIPDDICKRAKIIWINYPNSPTGAVASRSYYEGLIKWARKHEIIIAADEGCYIDIYDNAVGVDDGYGIPISILEVEREGIITFYSLSKRNNMTGYRVGFVAGDRAIVEVFKKLKTNVDSGTPSIIQEAGILALNDDKHSAKMRKLYDKKREILFKALEGIGLEVKKPAATFYVWQKIPHEFFKKNIDNSARANVFDSGLEFAKKLLDPKIAIVVTPGSLISDECNAYSPHDGKINPGEDYVRFALMPSVEEMKKASKRLNYLLTG